MKLLLFIDAFSLAKTSLYLLIESAEGTMPSSFIRCVSVLLNIELIYCAHLIGDQLQDNVTNYHTVNNPHNPSLSDGDLDTGKRIKGVFNWTPKDQFTPTVNYYDLTTFVENLNLQHCVIVEIGEKFCALFVETLIWEGTDFTPNGSVPNEQFLGICDCATIRSWHLCRTNLKLIRREDCTFSQATASETSSARVHRRLCDITGMASWNLPCNCSQQLASQLLTSVIGFPTCYLPPLPESICEPRNVCGTFPCTPVKGDLVYSAFCDASFCPGKNPFCEFPVDDTSMNRIIKSNWTPWSVPTCNTTCGFGYMTSEAMCLDYGGNPALDCIGPGSTCCAANETQCECHVIHGNNNIMLAIKSLGPCTSYTPCVVLDVLHGKRQIAEKQSPSEKPEENVIPPNVFPAQQLVNDNVGAQDLNNVNSRTKSLNQRLQRFKRELQRLHNNYATNLSCKQKNSHFEGIKKYVPLQQVLEKRRDKFENHKSPFVEMKERENYKGSYDDQDNHYRDYEELKVDRHLGYQDVAGIDSKHFGVDEEVSDSNRFERLSDETYDVHPVFDVFDHEQETRPQSRKLLSIFRDYDDNRQKAKEDFVIYGHVIRKKDLSNDDFLMDLESKLDKEVGAFHDALYDEDDDIILANRGIKPNATEEDKDYDDEEEDDDDDDAEDYDDDEDGDEDDEGDDDEEDEETDLEDDGKKVIDKKEEEDLKKKKNCTTAACDGKKKPKPVVKVGHLLANSGKQQIDQQTVSILITLVCWRFLS